MKGFGGRHLQEEGDRGSCIRGQRGRMGRLEDVKGFGSAFYLKTSALPGIFPKPPIKDKSIKIQHLALKTNMGLPATK